MLFWALAKLAKEMVMGGDGQLVVYGGGKAENS